MKKYSIISIILCLLFLIACVPMPKEEAIVCRTDSTLEQAVVAAPVESYTFDAPLYWDETFVPRNREIRFSANIEIPTAEQFPVVTVRQHRLTASDVVSFLTSFCPGEWLIRENELSREELTEDLKKASNMYLGTNDDTGESIYGANEEEMQRIQKLIEHAPAEDTFSTLTESAVTLPVKKIPVKNSRDETWYLYAYGKETNSGLFLNRRRDSAIYPESWVMQTDSPVYYSGGLGGIKVSSQDAAAVGDAMIAALKLSDYRLAEMKKAVEVQTGSSTEYSKGYLLYYVPALEGTVPCYYAESTSPDFLQHIGGESTYAPPWRPEYAELYITEEGLVSLNWWAPKEHVMTANENVQLLPFEEIQDSVKMLLEYGLGDWEGSPVLVKRMVLSTSVAQIPNQGNEAFFVPTWVIYLTTDEDEAIHQEPRVLLINAIDGTYISR